MTYTGLKYLICRMQVWADNHIILIFPWSLESNLSNHNLQYAPHIVLQWCYRVKAIISVAARLVYILYFSLANPR